MCHIKHILAADVKHIVAPQQQYARGARCALETQIGVGLGCYAEPKQGGLVRPVATLCFMRWPLYTLCDRSRRASAGRDPTHFRAVRTPDHHRWGPTLLCPPWDPAPISACLWSCQRRVGLAPPETTHAEQSPA